MPIYEYECIECSHKFELRRGFSDSDSEIKCPRCGAQHVQRAISLFASSARAGGSCGPTAST